MVGFVFCCNRGGEGEMRRKCDRDYWYERVYREGKQIGAISRYSWSSLSPRVRRMNCYAKPKNKPFPQNHMKKYEFKSFDSYDEVLAGSKTIENYGGIVELILFFEGKDQTFQPQSSREHRRSTREAGLSFTCIS